MLPINVTVITLMAMLSSLFPGGFVGSVMGNTTPTGANHSACSEFDSSSRVIYVRANNGSFNCNAPGGGTIETKTSLAHGMAHVVDEDCMNIHSRNYFTSQIDPAYQAVINQLGLGWNGLSIYAHGPAEHFADALAEGITGEINTHTGPHTSYRKDLALFEYTTCVDVIERIRVQRVYQALVNHWPDLGGEIYWTARNITQEADSRDLAHALLASSDYQNSSVSSMSDSAFVAHIFLKIHLRAPVWANGEWTAWVNHVGAVGRADAVADLTAYL